MTGVEIITAALVAGATAGVTNTANAAVHEAYTTFRDMLRDRLRGRGQAEQALAAVEADPGVWQTRLDEDLTDTGADTDDDILAAARKLLALIDPAYSGKYVVDVRDAKGVHVGDHNTQHITFS